MGDGITSSDFLESFRKQILGDSGRGKLKMSQETENDGRGGQKIKFLIRKIL